MPFYHYRSILNPSEAKVGIRAPRKWRATVIVDAMTLGTVAYYYATPLPDAALGTIRCGHIAAP
jgi:hypothetical protein